MLCVPALIRTRDGRIWWTAILMRWRFRWARARGLVTQTDTHRLPGALADTELSDINGAGVLRRQDRWSAVFDAQALTDDVWLDLMRRDSRLVVSRTTQVGSAVPPHLQPSDHAPALARKMLAQVSEPGAGVPNDWVTATWELSGLDSEQAHQQIAERLDQLPAALAPTDLLTLVTTALRPHAEPAEQWQHCGSDTATEHFTHYDHDDWRSVVWRATGTPGDPAPVTQGQPQVPLKRVTRVYGTDPRTGLVSQSIVVTATAPAADPAAARVAAAAVRAAAQQAELPLAPAAGSMLSTFVAGLGLGVLPNAGPGESRWNGLRTPLPQTLLTADEVRRQWPGPVCGPAKVPVGSDDAGRAVYCDPVSLHHEGLLQPPRVLVSGTCEALLRRWVLGSSALGSSPIVVSDQNGHLADSIEAIGGTVITIGRDHHTINPLDDPESRRVLVEILLTAAGEQSLEPHEVSALDGALGELSGQWLDPEPPQLWHLESLLKKRPDAARLQRLLSSIRHHYADVLDQPSSVVLPSESSALCLRVDPMHARDQFLMATLTSLCWSYASKAADPASPRLIVADGVTAVEQAGVLPLGLGLLEGAGCVTLVADEAPQIPMPSGLIVTADGDVNTFTFPGVPPVVATLTPGTIEHRLAQGVPAADDASAPLTATPAPDAADAALPNVAPIPAPAQTLTPTADPTAADLSGSPPRRRGRFVLVGAAAASLLIGAAIVTQVDEGPQQPAATPAVAAPGGGLAAASTAQPAPGGHFAAAAPVAPAASGLIAAASPVTAVVGGILASGSSVPPRAPQPGGVLVASADAPAARPGAQVITAAARPAPSLPLHLRTVAWSAAATWQQARAYVPAVVPAGPVMPIPAAPAPIYPAPAAPAPAQPAYPQPAPVQPGPRSGEGTSVPAPGAPPPNEPFNPQNPDSMP
jgi:hypothetical protein